MISVLLPAARPQLLAQRLKGRTTLIANDISTSEAGAAAIWSFRISNIITNETLCPPCRAVSGIFPQNSSGRSLFRRGMFRKEEALAKDWTPEKSHELARAEGTDSSVCRYAPSRRTSSLFYLYLCPGRG